MYKRVLLKLSGESLGGPAGKGLDTEWLEKYAKEVAAAAKAGLQIAIVNGGGNIFRGLQGVGKGFDRVDGVYTADPEKDPSAVKYDELSFDEAISKHLKVMDQTAYALCSDGNMPIIVFDMNATGNLTKLLKGEKVGTLVHP